MAYVVGLKDVQTTMRYEPGLKHTFALTQETCGAKKMCMFKSVIPPATFVHWVDCYFNSILLFPFTRKTSL